MSAPMVVACVICGRNTHMTGTERCDRCYELESRIMDDKNLALRILSPYMLDYLRNLGVLVPLMAPAGPDRRKKPTGPLTVHGEPLFTVFPECLEGRIERIEDPDGPWVVEGIPSIPTVITIPWSVPIEIIQEDAHTQEVEAVRMVIDGWDLLKDGGPKELARDIIEALDAVRQWRDDDG